MKLESLHELGEPRQACVRIWNLTTFSGEDFRKALKAGFKSSYFSLEECTAASLVQAAKSCLEANVVDDAGRETATILCKVLDANSPFIASWFKDFKVNAARHPDPWCECALVMQRGFLGEMLSGNRSVPFVEAEKRLLDWFDSENLAGKIWDDAWERQLRLIEKSLEKADD